MTGDAAWTDLRSTAEPAAPGSSRRSRPTRVGRHGDGIRGPLAWPRVPAMSTRSEDFDETALNALERVEHRLGRPLDMLQLAVEDVQAHDPTPWETEVALGRTFYGTGRDLPRVVIYRRPIEARALGVTEVADLIEQVVAEQVAGIIGIHPDDLQD